MNRDGNSNLEYVTIIVAAYNEEKVIEKKIKNILGLSYPKEKICVIIASDGSNDRTNEIVKKYESNNIKLIEFPRMGKVNVLNNAVPRAKSGIIVFSDANTIYHSDALTKLVKNFEDHEVGCVCGKLILVNPNDVKSGEGEGFYWRFETWIKKAESGFGCVVGANGAIYAIRKSLFEKMPENVINDDFHISMKIMEQGYKVVYENDAVGIEEVAPDFKSEFSRHVRDGAGHYREIVHLASLLNPLKGRRFFTYLSHRVIRWIVPFLLIVAFVSNMLLVGSTGYKTLFIIQSAFYIMAIAAFFMQKYEINIGIFNIPFFFISVNTALFIGFIKNMLNLQTVTWERTERI